MQLLLGTGRAYTHVSGHMCTHRRAQARVHVHAGRPFLHDALARLGSISNRPPTSPVVLSLFPTFKFNLQFLPCQAGLPAGRVVNELEAQNIIRGPEDGGLALHRDPETQGSPRA